jgi:hypothetical protein
MKLKNDVRWVGVFKTVPLLLLELGFFCVAWYKCIHCVIFWVFPPFCSEKAELLLLE